MATQRDSVPTPLVLYKYYAFNQWTQYIFERNEVYFQSPDGFNDPFDSKTPMTYEGTEKERVSRLADLWRKWLGKPRTDQHLRCAGVRCGGAKPGHTTCIEHAQIVSRTPAQPVGRLLHDQRERQHTHVGALHGGPHRVLPRIQDGKRLLRPCESRYLLSSPSLPESHQTAGSQEVGRRFVHKVEGLGI